MENVCITDIVIGFIGGGKMALAMAQGFVASGLLNPGQIMASSPSAANDRETPSAWSKLGITRTVNNMEVISKSNVLIISVKPYQVSTVMPEIDESFRGLLMTVVAGHPISLYISPSFPERRFVRLMPNTPCAVQSGCTAVSYNERCSVNDKELVYKLCLSLGEVFVVPESLQSGIVGVAGSGAGFMYVVLAALADGGVKIGLPRSTSQRLAAQTMVGAGRMFLESEKHPGALKDDVCSPGGSTIAGIHELEKAGVRAAIMSAVETAANHFKEAK